MSIRLGIYRCKVCGNIVQTLISGEGELVCCGEEMELLEAKYEESELGEKHVPIFEIRHEGCDTGMCSNIKYSSVLNHPMTKEHYIQFIEVCNQDKSEIRIKFFSPECRAEYKLGDFEGELTAKEYCNIHGLWRSKI